MIDAIESQWLQDFLVEFLKTPSEVPAGETEIKPGDPRILRAVNDLLLPTIESMDPDEIRRHPLGDVCARFGPAGDRGLLVLTYVVSQHANLMDDPHSGRIIDGSQIGLEGPAVVGQGATQNKGSLAAAFAAVRALSKKLKQPVWLAVNTEGESSHGGSKRLLDDLHVSAAAGILMIGTDQKISIGNRGRVDIQVFVKGKSAHSSQPWLGANPIEGCAEVVSALRDLPLAGEHPDLGSATATPYHINCYPVAPHTLPEECQVVVDLRLLPGEQPEDAVSLVRERLSTLLADPLQIRVEMGKWMLPALVDRQEPVVTALAEALQRVRGTAPEIIVSRNTFDAGYACEKGIPTPMYGPGRRHFSGDEMMGLDAVSLKDCIESANVLLRAMQAICG